MAIVDEIFPIGSDDMILEKDLVLTSGRIPVRDRAPAAVIKNDGDEQIFSFDSDFDVFSFITSIA